MITCHKDHLQQRCVERGYRLSDVMGCVVKQDGDMWTVDPSHPSYPVQRPRTAAPAVRPTQTAKALPPPAGPGTELKLLLKKIGINSTENCSCNRRAKVMDEKGIEWVEQNIPTVVSWLREEAMKRKLPFVDMAGAALVRMAIRNAKKKSVKK